MPQTYLKNGKTQSMVDKTRISSELPNMKLFAPLIFLAATILFAANAPKPCVNHLPTVDKKECFICGEKLDNTSK